MDAEEFVEAVESQGAFESRADAVRATEAVMRTFGDRLREGEAEEFAGLLPDRFGRLVLDSDHEPGAKFGLDEFTERVARRESTPKATACDHVNAVAAVVRGEASDEALCEVTGQLQPEFEGLFYG